MSFKKNFIAFLIISIAGAISHFVYSWTGENTIVGLFFPVNESVWEHLKLIFFPCAIYFTVEYFITKERPENYIPASIKAIFFGMWAIITLYYVITGVLGKNVDFLNILVYFISVIVVIIKRNKNLSSQKNYSKTASLLYGFFAVLTVVLFMIWSYNPPSLDIFAPPDSHI